MNTRQQGDIGVAQAIAYYTSKQYVVSFPLTDSARYDLVVDINGKLNKVQVKTTSQFTKDSVPRVELRTLGGNQSWSGVVKRISSDEIDLLFVYHLNGEAWELPVDVVDGRSTVNLGKLQEMYKVLP